MTASFQDRDPDVRPADDLFRHVNGSWLSTTTIPNDQASTGSFRVLRDNSEAAVHDILEELTSGDATSCGKRPARQLTTKSTLWPSCTADSWTLPPSKPSARSP